MKISIKMSICVFFLVSCSFLFSSENSKIHILKTGSVKDIKKVINKSNVNNTIDECYPLHWTVIGNNLEGARFLISIGADVNEICEFKDELFGNPVDFAASLGYLDIIKLLVKNKSQYDHTILDYCPIIKASRNGHLPVVKYFIKLGVHKDIMDANAVTPIYAASQGGHLDIVQYLLNIGADYTGYTENYRGPIPTANPIMDTPVHVAASNGHLEIVRLFLKKGINVNLKNWYKESILDCAKKSKNKELIEFLKSKGAK